LPGVNNQWMSIQRFQSFRATRKALHLCGPASATYK
jgi:hypothetical protein